MVLQSAGPKNASSMPEAGYLAILTKLARTGVKDLLRISDPRMSGIYSSMQPCLPSVRWDKLLSPTAATPAYRARKCCTWTFSRNRLGGAMTSVIALAGKRGNMLPGILPLFPLFGVISLIIVGAKNDISAFRERCLANAKTSNV